MPHDIWFISDLHLGHENILKFTNYDNSQLRAFSTIEQMHECIYDRWNETVKPGDKAYVLGDVAFGAKGMSAMLAMDKLPGKKRLVLGNHDKFQIEHYRRVFHEIYGFKNMNGAWLSHAPTHPASISGRKAWVNIHGHMHNNAIQLDCEVPGETAYEEVTDGLWFTVPVRKKIDDPLYFNVCCERVNYTPIHIEDIRQRVTLRREAAAQVRII